MSEAPEPADELELMPRIVRDKLDRVQIKVHLRDWQKLSLAERILLRDLPCADDADAERYGKEVARLVMRVTGRPPEALVKRGR
jgi:hypothetical protein